MPWDVQPSVPRVHLFARNEIGNQLDLSPFVQQLSVSKNVEQPAGQWSMTLMAQDGVGKRASSFASMPDLATIIQPNNVVSLGVEEDGGIAMGFVSSVQVSRQRIGGQVKRTLQMSGGTSGKALVQDSLVLGTAFGAQQAQFINDIEVALGVDHPLTRALLRLTTPRNAFGEQTFRGQGPRAIAEWALRQVSSMRIPLFRDAYGSANPGDVFSTAGITSWNDSRVWSDVPQSLQGSVFSFLRQMLDTEFYEVRCDEVPVPGRVLPQPVLIIRPRPWDDRLLERAPYIEDTGATWDNARTLVGPRVAPTVPQSAWVIDDMDVYSEAIGWGDKVAPSYYLVSSRHTLAGGSNSNRQGLNFPLVDLFAVQRFGLRPMGADLNLLLADPTSKRARDRSDFDEFRSEVIVFRNRLFNWHWMAPWMNTGTITVRGRDRYRPGDPVELPYWQGQAGGQPGMRFYAVSTTHSWTSGGNYTVQIGLDRGYNGDLVRAAKGEIEVERQRLNRDNATRLDIERQIAASGLVPGQVVGTSRLAKMWTEV